MPEVRVIPPVAERAHKLRVAAYARVSSDSADQLTPLLPRWNITPITFNQRTNGNSPDYTPMRQ